MENIQIINCEQGTEEWFQHRAGVVTASEVHFVMAQGRGGGPSETRKKYMYRMASELITGKPAATGWNGNAHTERGKEQEDVARKLYEDRTGSKVDVVGFVKNGFMGCSPDGLVGDDGGMEIKCKIPDLHIDLLMKGEVPSEHNKQIQMSLMVTGRQWWDFVSYSEGLPLFIKRVLPDAQMHRDMRVAIKQFEIETQQLQNKLMEMF